MNNNFLVWGDLETGGLNGRLDNGDIGMQYYPIFELAIIVTDTNLVEIGKPLRIAIYQDSDAIKRSSEWAVATHTDSGLLKEVQESTFNLAEAEQAVIQYLKILGVEKYNRETKEGGVFAGNSIMFDRTFIMCQMPTLHEYLHYRQIDISALALAFRYWLPSAEKLVTKQYSHEALADIRESIAEAQVYKKLITRRTPTTISIDQVREIAAFSGIAIDDEKSVYHNDPESLETEITIEQDSKITMEDGQIYNGTSAHFTEYPEEGSITLEDSTSYFTTLDSTTTALPSN